MLRHFTCGVDVQLFIASVLLTCGLAWFFAEAWVFAVEAKTGWLIVLLAATSTIVILTQGYLCYVMISTHGVVSVDVP